MLHTVCLASDHSGFELKKEISKFILGKNIKIIDLGPDRFDPLDDYPDFAFALAKKIIANKDSLGVLLCRNGIGMSIAVNKVKGIRAGICTHVKQAITAKIDDNCNVLIIAADFTSKNNIIKIVDTFLETEFNNEERHLRRLKKIAKYENSYIKEF